MSSREFSNRRGTLADPRPGLSGRRLIKLMREAIARCELQLDGAVVLTEAASGAYVTTPVIGALAGARVFAYTNSTSYGGVEEIGRQTLDLATLAGVQDQIEVVTKKTKNIVAQADIITNSGHLRPIDADMIGWMKPTAVVPLMYEAWEYRPADLDFAACKARGIHVAGTNEQHPAVNVFSYLGAMAVKLLHDAGLPVWGNQILLLCDNPFEPFLVDGLTSGGAKVTSVQRIEEAGGGQWYDALLVALRPKSQPVLDLEQVARLWPGAVVAQFWGDIDRSALHDVPVWPLEAPAPGHMGILPSEVGPEPIVRLQTGGLRVGELLWRDPGTRHALVQPLEENLVQTWCGRD